MPFDQMKLIVQLYSKTNSLSHFVHAKSSTCLGATQNKLLFECGLGSRLVIHGILSR